MTTPRLFLPHSLEIGAGCTAAPDQARYARTVLRMREGDSLLTFDGMGWEYEAVIRRLTADEMELKITGRRRLPASDLQITLCQGVPKTEKMDGIVRHATELGAKRILPFLAERSVPRWSPERLISKRERWQKIAVEASRQCGRPDIPEIGAVTTFEGMIRVIPQGGLRLIPWEEETNTGLREILTDPGRSGSREFVVAVGPEGGFSADEIELARKAGFFPVSLGKRVLRVETASLAVLAILQYEKGDPTPESKG